MVHSCMVYTEHTKVWHSFMWHQPCQYCKYITSVTVQKHTIHTCTNANTHTHTHTHAHTHTHTHTHAHTHTHTHTECKTNN